MFLPCNCRISDRLVSLVLSAHFILGILSKPALVDSFKATSPKVLADISPRSVSLLKMESQQSDHPFCQLPGDPSLILTTNVDLGSAKLDIMKGLLHSWSLAFCPLNPKSRLMVPLIFW
jgi:hypothetical protein